MRDPAREFAQASADGVVGCIFSKDRAFQLEATLRSFRSHAQDAEGARLAVLFRATDARHAQQYSLLARTYPDVTFVAEQSFREDLFSLIGSPRVVMFLVDDTLIVRRFSLQSAVEALTHEPRALGFSLRLGINTTHFYMLDRPQALPAFQPVGPGMLQYDWRAAEHDFGYPLEVSSSLYRTAELIPLLRDMDFRNPNTLEAELATTRDTVADRHPLLLCFERSVAFSAPLNLVQQEFPNRSRGGADCSVEALSQLFDQGLRLDVAAWNDHTARGAHEEIDLKLVRL
jgi:hypothetical protein